MSNISCASGDQTSVSSGGNVKAEINHPPLKRKRNLPGNPDPDAEVIALSPATLMAKNRFVCEICSKGFQRDQNLQLHRRGHNLPWKLKLRNNKDVIRKKVYVCPETSCVHHEASRALGDLTGIKKHFSRKHGEKKWKCERCTKRYAVQSDWKAHSKTCGTREYRCDCGTIFSRRDSFITHRAFCDALAEESGKSNAPAPAAAANGNQVHVSAASSNGTCSNNNNVNDHQNHSSPVQPHIFNNLTQHHHLRAFSMKKEEQTPQWLAPPVDLQDPQSRATPIIHMQHQHFTDHHSSSPYHQDLTQPITSLLHNSNPNPSSTGFGPTSCAPAYIISSADQYVTSPHMSATALLQKAALMGATISTQTSSSSLPSMAITLTRPHQADQVQEGFLSSSKNKDSCPTREQKSHATTTGAGEGASPPLAPSNPFHQNHIDMDHESTNFKDFDGFLKEDDHDPHPAGGVANDIGMTRDFLGLRPLSNTDILNIANLQPNCANVNNTSTSDDHDHKLI